MASIKAHIGKQKFRTEITSATNTLISDEPLDLGGEDLGFSPGELLASSLAACTAATLRMYADHKNWPLDEVKIEVKFERDTQTNTASFIKVIEFFGDLDEKQIARLTSVASACPIHKVLTNPVTITTEII
jgi:putative redox protein